MRNYREQVLLGARIPLNLKENLSSYCFKYGVKINYFVAEAIKEKLQETAEDNKIMAIAKERLENAEFVSQEEFDKYLHKRGIEF